MINENGTSQNGCFSRHQIQGRDEAESNDSDYKTDGTKEAAVAWAAEDSGSDKPAVVGLNAELCQSFPLSNNLVPDKREKVQNKQILISFAFTRPFLLNCCGRPDTFDSLVVAQNRIVPQNNIFCFQLPLRVQPRSATRENQGGLTNLRVLFLKMRKMRTSLLNLACPKNIEDQVQRIGCTGCAGAKGMVITLFSESNTKVFVN